MAQRKRTQEEQEVRSEITKLRQATREFIRQHRKAVRMIKSKISAPSSRFKLAAMVMTQSTRAAIEHDEFSSSFRQMTSE